MNYNEFSIKFLAALYLETETNGSDYLKSKYLIEKYNLPFKKQWISRIADDWQYSYFQEILKVLAGYHEWSFRISADGARKVEIDIGDEASVLKFLSLSDKEDDERTDIDKITDLDSVNWTGIGSKIDAAQIKEIKSQANSLIDTIRQSDMDERSKKNAEGHVLAVIRLVEVPDPPWKSIVELLASKELQAMLSAVTIVQFITGISS